MGEEELSEWARGAAAEVDDAIEHLEGAVVALRDLRRRLETLTGGGS